MPWEEALKNTSYSRQKTLQRCPKKFEYQYVQDLAPKREKDAFLLGKAVHHFLEIYYRTQINQDQDTAYQKAQEAYDEYAQIHFPDDEKALEQYELGKEMLRHYHSWAKENDQFRVIETEIQYELKIADSLDRGIWDGLVEMNGKYWILEHKTYKQIKTNHTLHDAQISKYFLVAEKNNIPVEGVIYNILKKAVPQKPRLLKNGKLSKSLSKNMTYDSYLAAIHEHGHQPEGYQDVLEKLKNNPILSSIGSMFPETNFTQNLL